jgi:undecaprenyl-diphosphatase
MTLIQSIILGIVQGLTEFLPISSSAHLVLIPHLFGWNLPEAQVFPFDVLVQLGTLVAVIIYFWNDLWTIVKAFVRGLVLRKPFDDPNSRLGWYLILASVPAMFAGLLLKSKVEAVFNDPNATAYFLFATAALLVLAETIGKRTRGLTGLKWFDALWIGLFQAVSIFPGISRSGSTIAAGMLRNMERPAAARFSFLMSIPVMLGAGLVSTLDVIKLPGLGDFLPLIFVGFVAALLVGYLSIHWLLNFLNKRSFYWFAAYCVLLAAVVLTVGAIQKNAQATGQPASAEVTQAVLINSAETLEPLSENPLTVAYTSSLEWVIPAMSTCAATLDNFSIVSHSVTANQYGTVADSVFLRWGAPDELSAYAAVLGEERLAFIVNPQNPISNLPVNLVREIASGMTSSWGTLYEKCPECLSGKVEESLAGTAPALAFYSATDESQALFSEIGMGGTPIAAASALLVPGAVQMRDSIASTPAGFGFLPARFLNTSVKEVSLAGIDLSALELPILAITAAEPNGNTREWLLCLQTVLNP